MRSTNTIASFGAYVRSVYDSWSLHSEFDSVQRYVMFVGYPRSGHSLIGALMNAHPRMLIAHELDALKFLQRNASRGQLYSLIWRRNEEFVRAGYKWEGYDYDVPGQAQDRCELLRVIGDKKGGASALRLRERPELIEQLRETVRVPIRIIHITRNPFDNVVTISTREKMTLHQASEKFRRHCEGVNETLRRTTPEEIVTLRYEDFVADPKRSLSLLCDFAGESASDDYLAACASRVFASPSRTRDKVQWTAEDRREVEALIGDFPFLSAYGAESDR